jgi:hypothetical protein
MPEIVGRATHFIIVARDGPPAHVVNYVVPLILKWQHLVPRWCRSISLKYSDANDQGDMGTITNVEYRWASIRVYPPYFNDLPEVMEQNVIHELIHISMERTLEFVRFIFSERLPEEERYLIQQMFTREYEGTVEDLAIAIFSPERDR